jgi:hypothetical protein
VDVDGSNLKLVRRMPRDPTGLALSAPGDERTATLTGT